MGNFTSKDYKNVPLSPTIPYLKNMEENAKNLVLNLPKDNYNNFSQSMEENQNLQNIFHKNLNYDNLNDDLSDTSPFISSEKYNFLLNNQKGGGDDDDESSTTTTDDKSDKSSSDKSNDSDDSKSEDPKISDDMLMKMSEEMGENIDEKMKEMESENSEMSSGMSLASYLSSSEKNNSNSETLSTISIKNNKLLSDSINTSDINMISIDSN